jgi:hypothetical protein
MQSPNSSITCALFNRRDTRIDRHSRVKFDHHQQAQTAPIVRARFHEIVTPDVIAMLRSQSNTGAVVQPRTPKAARWIDH